MILQSLPWDLLIVWATPQRQCLLRSWTLQKKGNLLLGLFPSKVCTLFFQLLWDIYTLQKKKKNLGQTSDCVSVCDSCCTPSAAGCDSAYWEHVCTDPHWLPVKHNGYFWQKWTCSVSRKCSSANNFHATFVVLKGPALAASCRQYFGGVHCRPGIHFVRNTPQSMDSLHHFICQSASRKSCDPLEMV